MKAKGKKETLAEYLARGGTIKVVAPGAREPQVDAVKQIPGGAAKLLTQDEAELYYSEGKQRKVKPKPQSTIDISALPEALRKKFIDRVGDIDLFDRPTEGDDDEENQSDEEE